MIISREGCEGWELNFIVSLVIFSTISSKLTSFPNLSNSGFGTAYVEYPLLGVYDFYKKGLSPAVRPPHHFAAKRIEKDMIEAFHYFHAVVGTANSELSRFFASFTAAVDGNQKVITAALHV